MFGQVKEGGERVGREVVPPATLQHVRYYKEASALQHVLLYCAARLYQGAHEAEEFWAAEDKTER